MKKREDIIKKIKENNLNRALIEKNLKIWQNKLLKIKQERVVLDEELYKIDNKPLFQEAAK